MGIGAITIDNGGSATAPSTLALSLPTPDTYRATNHGPMALADLPWILGVMWANGHDQLRHIVTNVLKTGILAPETGPTVTPTGTKAVMSLNCDADAGAAAWDTAVDNDAFIYYPTPSVSASPYVQVACVSPLSSYGATSIRAYILKGADDTATAANLVKFINQTGIEGVDYLNPRNAATGAVVTEALPDRTWSATSTGAVVTATALRSGTLANQNIWTTTDLAGGAVSAISVSITTAGTDGTGTTPEAGIHNYATIFLRTEDQALSGRSPKTEVETDAGMEIDLTNIPAPDDPDNDVDYVRVLRTGIEGVSLYRLADIDEDAGLYGDTTALATLLTRTLYDPDLYSLFPGGYPPRGRCLSTYKGRVNTAGARIAADYTAGTAAVVNGNNEVTLTGAYPTVHWIGREFQVAGDSLRYPIVRVDSATKKLYLATDFQGSTNATASYVVKDTRDPYELHTSEPELPNAWPGNSDRGVNSTAHAGVTSLVDAFGVQVIHTLTNMYAYSSEDGTVPQIHKVSDVAGCVGPRAAILVKGVLYWLGTEGIYMWAGSGEPLNIAAPELIGGEAVGIQTTLDRLNERQLDQVVCCYDTKQRVIRWAVPLDDDVTNRYMLVLDLNARVITVDECEDITDLAEIVDAAGGRHVLAGDVYGNVFELGVGENDGAYGFEAVQTVTASDKRTITVGGTPFPTASGGLAGLPVYMVSATGDFTRAKIASNTSSVLTLTAHLSAGPAATTQIVVGGVLWRLKSGRWHGGRLREEKDLKTVTVGFVPQTRGQVWLATAVDQGTPSLAVGEETEIDLTDTTGRAVVFPGQVGYLQQQEFIAIGPNFTPKIHALEYEVAYEERR